MLKQPQSKRSAHNEGVILSAHEKMADALEKIAKQKADDGKA